MFNTLLDRENTHDARRIAAEELIARIAVPFLSEFATRQSRSSPLNSIEERTALTYITLQLHDDEHEKGLTKVCFDALVRAALRHSSMSAPVTRQAVHENVCNALPTADAKTVLPLVDASLARLRQNVVTHNSKGDSFFLGQRESNRIRQRLADTAVIESKFKSVLETLSIEYLATLDEPNPKDVADLRERIPRIIETLCLLSGEHFVTAVRAGRVDGIRSDQLHTVVINDLAKHKHRSRLVNRYPELIQHVIRAVAVSDDASTREYLRSVFTSYTLMSFLNQTPDVQRATRRIFSHGSIWIDTSAVLPLFAEQLFEHDHSRIYQTIFEACRREHDELFITSGVVDEIEHHMQLCLLCLTLGSTWQGNVPYLLSCYLQTGRNAAEFRDWLEEFRGDQDPALDIELYLNEVRRIRKRDLSEAVQLVDAEVRYAVDRMWGEAHATRRVNGDGRSSEFLKLHDVEMYLGVMGLRTTATSSELGAREWLLTRDTTAWNIRNAIRTEFPNWDRRSPLLSVSYLINAIAFSPSRVSLGRSVEVRLPTILDVELEEIDCEGLLKVAEDVRKENEGLPERLVRRKVRERIDTNRMRAWARAGAEENDVS